MSGHRELDVPPEGNIAVSWKEAECKGQFSANDPLKKINSIKVMGSKMLLETAENLTFRVLSERSPYNEVFKITQFLKKQTQAVCFVGALFHMLT